MESAPTYFQTPIKSEHIVKSFQLNYNDKIYELILSLLINEKKEKFVNFNLKEKVKDNLNSIKYYESTINLNDLGKLFLINLNKYPNIDEIIFSKIEIFHSKNNVMISKNNNDKDILNLIYIQKILDNDDYEIKIELKEKNEAISNENEILKLSGSFSNLSKEIEEMKLSFEKKLIRRNKPMIESVPPYYKSDPTKLTKLTKIKEVVDGGRGMNDHFAVYNLVKDPKKRVYVAIKNKLENKNNSFINILILSK